MIKNDTELNKHQNYLKILDDTINLLSNEALKTSLIETYIAQMETIDVFRNRRLGCHFLITAYNASKKVNNTKEYIIIQDQTSLVDLSNAYYGIPDYYQYIYEENNLTSLVLEAGQKIILPDIPNNAEMNMFDSYIRRAEAVTLAYDDLGIL
jgi:hypothetical protein